MACSVASDNSYREKKNVSIVNDEENSIEEELPYEEQELVISLPNSAATTVRNKQLVKNDAQMSIEDDIIDEITFKELPFMTQTTVAAQIDDEIGEETHTEGTVEAA